MQMIMFVLDNPNQLDAVLDAWAGIGMTGITFVESTGFNRWRAQRPDAHFMLTFHRLPDATQEGHYTLFAIVEQEETVQRCIEVTEAIVGDLDEPNTGVIASWPLTVVKGVPGQSASTEKP